MQWAAFVGIALLVLTISILGNSIAFRTDLYFYSYKWYPSDIDIEANFTTPYGTPFVNVSSFGSLTNKIEDYVVGDSGIKEEIPVSYDAGMQKWTKTMLGTNDQTSFYTIIDNQTYMVEMASTTTLESQVIFNEALFIITIGMWIALGIIDYRGRHKEKMIEVEKSASL